MSKKQKKVDDPRQLNIYDLITLERTKMTDDSGVMRVKDELRNALNLALKSCSLSRHQVAGEMSHFLNEEISKAMLDAWTAESKSDRHIPAEYIPAFCKATGCNAPLDVLNRKIGLFPMEGPDALRSEIHQLREDTKKLQREIRKREQLLDAYIK